MTAGPIANLPPWDVERLQTRLREVQTKGIRGKHYPKPDIDAITTELFGLVREQTQEHEKVLAALEEAKTAAEAYIDRLQLFEAENPEAVLMPHQAQNTMMRVQKEADDLVRDAQEFSERLIEDANATADGILAEAKRKADALILEAESQGKSILNLARHEAVTLKAATEAEARQVGHLAEPASTNDKPRDADLQADWLDECQAFITRRRTEIAESLKEEIERFQAAYTRVVVAEPMLEPEPSTPAPPGDSEAPDGPDGS